jgi:hypothetical protein
MTTVSGSAFEFSLESTGGLWRWKVVSQNVSGAGVSYEVSCIDTPWGPLYQTAIPVPADVIQAMAQGIVEVQQQLSPLLALLNPSQVSFVVVITEGDPNLVVADVPFFNAGAFGSSLTATATPSAAWLRADPGQVAGLGKNDQGEFTVTLFTGSLAANASPYLAVVNLQDNRVPSTLISLAFSVSVLPRPVIAVDQTDLSFTWYQTTSSGDGPFTVHVLNSGPPSSSMGWAAALLNASRWLSFTPASGGPLSSSASQSVSLSLNPSCVPASPGIYVDRLRFSSPTSSNGYVDVQITLNILP